MPNKSMLCKNVLNKRMLDKSMMAKSVLDMSMLDEIMLAKSMSHKNVQDESCNWNTEDLDLEGSRKKLPPFFHESWRV